MRTLLYVLYQPYKWFVFVPLLLVSTLAMGGVAVVLATCVSPRFASLTCGVWWARFIGFITPMRVAVKGREHVDPKQSYVIVSNHRSHYDVFVLYGWLGIDFKWVMKKELRKLPALGIACEKIGHIYIDRSNHETAIASLEEAKRKIVNGTSILFFPEGTRRNGKELGPFKKGAFVMAQDLGLPLLPITINNTSRILPPRTMRLFPGHANMVIHDPIAVAEYKAENIEELMEAARRAIEAGIQSE